MDMEGKLLKSIRFNKVWDFHRIHLHLSKLNELQLLMQERAGFDYFEFSLRNPLPVSSPPVYIFNNFPEEINRIYDTRQYWKVDPILNRASKKDYAIWSVEVDRNEPISELLAYNDEFRDGVTFWFSLRNGSIASISLAGPSVITNTQAQALCGEAYYLCKTALDMVIAEKKVKCESCGEALSGQELRILRLTADGMTAEQIADRIHVTKSTVSFHMKNINKKLCCRNKTQAIAKAALMSIL